MSAEAEAQRLSEHHQVNTRALGCWYGHDIAFSLLSGQQKGVSASKDSHPDVQHVPNWQQCHTHLLLTLWVYGVTMPNWGTGQFWAYMGAHGGVTWGTHGATTHGAHGGAHTGVTCCVAALQAMASEASWNASRNTWGRHMGQKRGADTWGRHMWETQGGADLLCSCAPGNGIRGLMECQQESIPLSCHLIAVVLPQLGSDDMVMHIYGLIHHLSVLCRCTTWVQAKNWMQVSIGCR